MDDRSKANLQEGIALIDDVTDCLAGLRIRLWKALNIELVLQPDAEGEEPKRPVTAIGKGGGKANGNLVNLRIEKTRNLS